MLVLRFDRRSLDTVVDLVCREVFADRSVFLFRGHAHAVCVVVMPRGVPVAAARNEFARCCVDPDVDTLFAAPASPEEGEAIIAALARTGIVHTCYVIEGIAPETPTP